MEIKLKCKTYLKDTDTRTHTDARS